MRTRSSAGSSKKFLYLGDADRCKELPGFGAIIMRAACRLEGRLVVGRTLSAILHELSKIRSVSHALLCEVIDRSKSDVDLKMFIRPSLCKLQRLNELGSGVLAT